jgi:hypothetical protein
VAGGASESSATSQASIAAVFPAMILVVLVLLMLQLQDMKKMALVLATAPLGMIGVALILATFRIPFGFVAMLGVIALFGMIIRNSVILVVQIDQDLGRGLAMWDAIVESTVRRFRPIVLTALAAILAMIPLTRSTFWGPMAWAIMGGPAVATLSRCSSCRRSTRRATPPARRERRRRAGAPGGEPRQRARRGASARLRRAVAGAAALGAGRRPRRPYRRAPGRSHDPASERSRRRPREDGAARSLYLRA